MSRAHRLQWRDRSGLAPDSLLSLYGRLVEIDSVVNKNYTGVEPWKQVKSFQRHLRCSRFLAHASCTIWQQLLLCSLDKAMEFIRLFRFYPAQSHCKHCLREY
jgi:hypothetical protein